MCFGMIAGFVDNEFFVYGDFYGTILDVDHGICKVDTSKLQ